MSISADDVNILIAAHLRETGAPHTAYIFSNEALVDTSISLPPQSLITILQKGMLYMQLEKSINARARSEESAGNIINSIVESAHQQEIIHLQKQIPKQKPATRAQTPISSQQIAPASPPPPEPLLEIPHVVELSTEAAQCLQKHDMEVFYGAWTPDSSAFATVSADATALIWLVKDHKFTDTLKLEHAASQDRANKGVVSLAWNSTGTLLATGCDDGTARLWTRKGALKFVLSSHKESIFAIQFSPNDKYLLTCSKDKQVIVWKVADGGKQQVFNYHEGSTLDVDWYDDNTFASCSGDYKILICQVGSSGIIKKLEGHTKDVNKISWDPTRKYLASCSDDSTVCVWRPFENADPIVFRGHKKEVYTIKWVPGVNSPRYLASGAFDNAIKVWDVPNCQCLYTIEKHTQPIFTISFSPRGKYFASGGNDMCLNIFRTADGAQIGKYNASGGLFDSAWSPNGEMIAICETDASVAVIPTSLLPNFHE